jgi:hypothetical protein
LFCGKNSNFSQQVRVQLEGDVRFHGGT